MRISTSLILASALIIFGCDDNETCTVNSIDDLGWLKQEIQNNGYYQNSYSDMIVYKVTYKGNTAIISLLCCPVCNTLPPEIKTCSGKVIGHIGVDDYGILDNAKVIWRTNNGVCPV
jgi:hypothetical protein